MTLPDPAPVDAALKTFEQQTLDVLAQLQQAGAVVQAHLDAATAQVLAANEQIATDQTQHASDTAQHATDAAANTQLQTAVVDLRAQIVSLNGVITALRAELAKLTPPPPPPPVTTTKFGAGLEVRSGETLATAIVRVEKTMGPLAAVRIYDDGKGLPTALGRVAQIGTRLPVLSFKEDPKLVVTSDAAINARIDAGKTITMHTDITYFHECDQSGRGFTGPEFIAAWRYIYSRLSGNKNLRWVLILTGWDYANRIDTWYPGDAYVDVLGVDPYQTAIGQTAAQTFAPHLAVAKAKGKPLAICETGSKFGTDSQKAQFVASLAAVKGQVEFVTYFNSHDFGTNDDYQIDQLPASAAAYKALS